jgi:hypothetical protein
MGGGKGKSSPPPQIDPGKSMGEFYFGKGFSNYQGVTDPRLQELFLGAEATYRPQYTALELADIGVMARGLEEREVADPRYTQTQERISELQAQLAKTPATISETRKTGGAVAVVAERKLLVCEIQSVLNWKERLHLNKKGSLGCLQLNAIGYSRPV